jgi:kinesin family protein 18/19
LREIGSNTRQSSLSNMENVSSDPAPEGNSGHSSSEEGDKWTTSDARSIGNAIKRRSSTNGRSVPVNAHRRRSPTAAAAAGSPPNENSLLSAGAARRMVKSNHNDADWKNSVLSPRTTPVMKGAVRRTTMANVGDESRPREAPPSLNSRAPVRIASGSSQGSRGSLMPNSKSVWR